MSAASILSVSGSVQEWPEGFSQSLPNDAWLVLHSYPKQEKRLIWDLRVRGFASCTFFERRVRHYRGKGRQTSLVPLLGGYVFVPARCEDKAELFATHRVVRILDVVQPAALARDLTALCRLVNATDLPLMVRPEIIAGTLIDIRYGTFAGCSGVVVRRQNRLELVVNLGMLGTSVSVTLPAELAQLAS
ncbi:MAG: hypothetical protein H0W83_13870 [Planctomycetes bacterium]|nr:hypothetical protein [Planctomycetota bacterium]